MAGKLTVAKVNIDENPQTPTKYGVRGIPTMILFKAGKVAATKVGALPKIQTLRMGRLAAVTGRRAPSIYLMRSCDCLKWACPGGAYRDFPARCALRSPSRRRPGSTVP